MKLKHIFYGILCGTTLATTSTSCTDLDETLYDQVDASNYYNTKMDVVRSVFRPFEHAYWSIMPRQALNELAADQIMTCTRDGWWEDAGKWRRLHYHTWTDTNDNIQTEWRGCYQGIGQCNYVIEDLETLSANQFGFTDAEWANLRAQSRTLRCWFYLRLLDEFRNVPLVVSYYDQSLNTLEQVDPKVLFEFIESELKECVKLLAVKPNAEGGNGKIQGQWTKAAAASLLVRLYLNAKVYIGEDRYTDCAQYAQDIIDGKYGTYTLADTWDAPFDWNNETCNEVIFGFPGSEAYTFWQYGCDVYWWSVPAHIKHYFNDAKAEGGNHNCMYACTPSHAPNGDLLPYQLGNTVSKYQKYPNDYRLKLYRNLGNSRREGMFLFGKLPCLDGTSGFVRDPNGKYDLNIRDAVGQFQGSEGWLSTSTSTLMDGDHNSGWHFAKYPFYSDDDEGQMESDYTEIRLAELYYSLAECKFRAGDVDAASRLLNQVRRRNYPEEDWNEYLYAPEGNAVLDEAELLDEWGREFFAEGGRRRTDLIRFDKFASGTWWDKTPDADNHTIIYCLTQDILNTNTALKQNPGY